jgi:chromosomal replication initiation ATPase DnaA
MKICPCCGFVEPAEIQKSTTKLKEEIIINTVCSYFGISQELLKSKYRYTNLVDARMYAAKLLLNEGMPSTDIGRILERDHTTIIHYKQKYNDLISYNPDVKMNFVTLKNMIYG